MQSADEAEISSAATSFGVIEAHVIVP